MSALRIFYNDKGVTEIQSDLESSQQVDVSWKAADPGLEAKRSKALNVCPQ